MKREFYSWEGGYSTVKGWDCRKPAIVHCDGTQHHRVLCCLTGEGGFLKKIETDSDGRTVAHMGNIVYQYVVGDVEVSYGQ